jgi:hypothetical protein
MAPRAAPVLWRAAEAAGPLTAGAVAVKLLKGGLGLTGARRPLIGN